MSGLPTLGAMRKAERTPFGQRLFGAREAAGLTQVQLAKKAKMAQSTLAGLEWSGRGSAKTAVLAELCGVTAKWLATGQGEPAAPRWLFSPALFEAVRKLKPDELLGAENSVRLYLRMQLLTEPFVDADQESTSVWSKGRELGKHKSGKGRKAA